jgi:hypothetical protein
MSARPSTPLVLMLLAAAGCRSHAPTQPSVGTEVPGLSTSLNLREGAQWLTLIGVTNYADLTLPPCLPPGSPPSGTWVTTAVTVSREGSDWVARSPSAEAGTIELRFRVTRARITGIDVHGTIRGTAFDMRYTRPRDPTDSHVTFGGDTTTADVIGWGDPNYSLVRGDIKGAIRYADPNGRSGSCSVIVWSLSPGGE